MDDAVKPGQLDAPPPAPALPAWRPWVIAAWGYAGLLALWLGAAGLPLDERLRDLLRLPVFVGPAAAALLAGQHRTARDRLGWRQVGLAWALSALAGLIWLTDGSGSASALGRFADDVLYNAYYPLMVAGLLLLARLPGGPGARLRLLVDAVVVVVATLALAWYLLLRNVPPEARPRHAAELLTNLVGETLVLLCAALALHRPVREAEEPGLSLLAIGAFAAAVADLTSAGAHLSGSAAQSAVSEVALAAAAALTVTAALLPRRPRRLLGQATDLLVRVVSHLPSLAVLVVAALLVRELPISGPGGNPVPVLAVALVVLAALAILRAVVAQRDAEAEAAARAAQEERLHHGRKLQVMGELAAAVSHDFANLLTALGGSASDLRERLPTAPEVEEIEHLVQRGTELCRGLTTFSRRTSPRGAADLRAVAGAVAPLLRRLLPAGCSLTVEGEAGVAWAVADPSQVEVALVNLVVNARDAMPKGGAVVVSADAPELPVPGRGAPALRRFARLTVRDDGTGMDPPTLARCVEPFFTTKPAERGTGLGLATVNGIALAAGGRLDIQSAPGQGTRVALILPLAATAAPAPGR